MMKVFSLGVVMVSLAACSPTPPAPSSNYTSQALKSAQVSGNGDMGIVAETKLITLSLTNNGTEVLQGPPSVATGDFQIVYQNNCNAVAVKKICQVKISFSAKGKVPGVYADTLQLDNITIPLQAEVAAPAGVVLLVPSVVSVDFGTLNNKQNVLKTLTIKNTGTAAFSEALAVTGGFTLSYSSCAPIAPGGSCTVKVSLVGATGLGDYTGALNVGSSLSIPLSGTVVSSVGSSVLGAPNLQLLSDSNQVISSVLFPEVVSSGSVQQILSLKNSGTADSDLLNLSISGAGYSLVFNQCQGKSLKVNQSCQLRILFSGQNRAGGSYGGLLSVNDLSFTLGGSVAGAVSEPQGLTLLKELVSGPDGQSVTIQVQKVNGKLVFVGNDENGEAALYSTDGSAASIVRLSDLPGTHIAGVDYFVQSAATGAALLNNKLFFSVQDWNNESNYERSLWVTDGTVGGTHVILNNFKSLMGFITVGDQVYFLGQNKNENLATSQLSLWKTDGMTTERVLVNDKLKNIMQSSGSKIIMNVGTQTNNNASISIFDTSDNSLTGTSITQTLLSDSCEAVPSGINGDYAALRCTSTVFGLKFYLVMIHGENYGYREVPNLNGGIYADGLGGAYYTYGSGEQLYYSTLDNPVPLVGDLAGAGNNKVSPPQEVVGGDLVVQELKGWQNSVMVSVRDNTAFSFKVLKLTNGVATTVGSGYRDVALSSINENSLTSPTDSLYFFATDDLIGPEWFKVVGNTATGLDLVSGTTSACLYQDSGWTYSDPWVSSQAQCLSWYDGLNPVWASVPKGISPDSRIIVEMGSKLLMPLHQDDAVGTEWYQYNP
jgi:hypothetical protein